ncbi:MAG: hypothetical protein AAF602_21205 [Myxococcota bacterium]
MVLVLRYLHLVAVATWLGGLLTLGALVPTLRAAGVDRPVLQAVARRFAWVSWSAMALAVVTGLGQAHLYGWWRYERLHVKLTAVGVVVGITLAHQLTARTTSPAMRGVLQGLILLASLVTFGVAVWL